MQTRMSLMVLSAVALVAACGEQDRNQTQTDVPVAPSFSAHAPPNSFSTKCSFTTASQLAGGYFTNNDTAKVVRTLIASMKTAGAGTTAAANIGFDVLAHVSANVGVDPDFTTGSAFVNEIIKCMFTDPNAWPASYTAPVPGPEDFTFALDPARNGAFGVRGGVSDPTGPVLARLDSYSGVAPSSGSWSSALVGNAIARVLLYGRPSVGQPGVDPNTFYNWRAVARNTTFSPPVIVGVCIDPNTNAFGDQKAVVRKQDQAGVAFLPFADAAFLIPGTTCTGPVSLRQGFMGTLAQGIFTLGNSFLGPKPLSATRMMNPGGLAGATGGIHTDYGPDEVDSVFLSFVIQPHDANVCTAAAGSGCSGNQTVSPVKVLATWKGFPVGGVRITVVPVNNNGTPAEIRGDSTLVTGEDGTVTYTNLGLTKPGGYALLTNAELVEQRSSQIVIPHVTSTKFNVRP
ncbi:MAG TPA: hypothetical protein VFP39_07050 [Gemmatimonadales bacterium]|nr:hypothetical protein [Gemmatimonadales bacterium]